MLEPSPTFFVAFAAGRHAQAAAAARSPHLRPLARRLLLAAVAAKDGGAKAQGVRWWLLFCIHGRGIPPIAHLKARKSR